MPAKYRADHIGSLLRPAELLQARNASSDTVQLRALEDKHILRVIAASEGSRLQDLYRRGAAPQQLHERFQRRGGRHR